MKILKEFKEFAIKGNVIDLAVGVVIGGAFGKIVTSLVNDVVMPCLSIITGGMHVSDARITLREPTEGGADGVFLTYGAFTQTVIDFLIIAVSIFFFIKAINKFRAKVEGQLRRKPTEADKPAEPAAAEPEPTRQELLLAEIRDLLMSQAGLGAASSEGSDEPAGPAEPS